jgi:hypothetical protein
MNRGEQFSRARNRRRIKVGPGVPKDGEDRASKGKDVSPISQSFRNLDEIVTGRLFVSLGQEKMKTTGWQQWQENIRKAAK